MENSGWTSSLIKNVRFPTITLLLGVLCFILGLTAIPVGSQLIEVKGLPAKILISLFGIVLIGIAIFAQFSGRRARKNPATTQSFLCSLDDEPSGNLTKFAKGATRIRITGRTGVNLFSSYRKFFQELSDSRCELEVILVDPSSSSAGLVYGRNSQTVYHNNVVSVLVHLRELKASFGDRMQVRKLNYLPTLSVIIVEKPAETFARVQLYFVHSLTGRDRPKFSGVKKRSVVQLLRRRI